MRLRTQITLTICSIIISLMSALGIIIYIKSAAIIDKSYELHMVTQLERVQEKIDMLVKINKLVTKELSLDKEVEAFLEHKIDTDEINSYLTNLMKEKNEQNNYYMDLFIMNKSGHIIASCMPIAMNLDLSTREYFIKSVETKETVTSDILIARSNKALIVNTSSPIVDFKGEILGYAGTAIYAEYFSDAVNNLKLGQTGYYSIIDTNNMILSHPDKNFISKPSGFSISKDLFTSDMVIKKIAMGLNDEQEYQIFKKMKSNQWILVASLPLKDMHAQSRPLFISVTLIGLIAIIVAVLLGILVSRKISIPIVAMANYMNIILNGATEFDESVSESIKILKKNYENIDEKQIENEIESNISSSKEITKLNQSFSNFKKYIGVLLANYEKENKSFMKSSEKMALSVSDHYHGISRFILTLSHDLKNSVTVIKGYSKGLKMGIVEDENTKIEFVNAIYQRTEELEKIIYDVLDSAYEAQTTPKMNKEHIDIEHFTDELVKIARQYVEGMSYSLNTYLDIKEGTMFIDSTKIKRVWNNLINNAIKYSTKDGIISIRIVCESEKIRFQVEDQGIGIGADEIDKIFNIFFRGNTIDKKGYGLGLFICKSIIEAHGSKIHVKSEKGKGSIFWFEIDCLFE